MSKEVENIVKSVLNPVTGKSLFDEDRIVSIDFDSEKVDVTYNRDGISVKQKRDIEDAFVSLLKKEYSEDKIFVRTSSTENSEVKKTEQKEQPANLNVGHGPAGQNKKRIPGVKNVIAISSCKGGVGKSSFAVNIAKAVQAQGKKVALIDADIYGPSLPILLGVPDAKPSATEDKKIKPIDVDGLKFISFGLFIEKNDAVIWRGPMLGGVLNQFFFDVDWGEIDYLFIDLPPGTGDVQLSMIQATEIDKAIIISTPQTVAIADTIKGLNMFKKLNVECMGMVENMSYFTTEKDKEKHFIFGEGGVKKAASELKENFLGEIPISINLRESCDQGKVYMSQDKYKSESVWNSYVEISKKVVDNCEGKKGILSKLFK